MTIDRQSPTLNSQLSQVDCVSSCVGLVASLPKIPSSQGISPQTTKMVIHGVLRTKMDTYPKIDARGNIRYPKDVADSPSTLAFSIKLYVPKTLAFEYIRSCSIVDETLFQEPQEILVGQFIIACGNGGVGRESGVEGFGEEVALVVDERQLDQATEGGVLEVNQQSFGLLVLCSSTLLLQLLDHYVHLLLTHDRIFHHDSLSINCVDSLGQSLSHLLQQQLYKQQRLSLLTSHDPKILRSQTLRKPPPLPLHRYLHLRVPQSQL